MPSVDPGKKPRVYKPKVRSGCKTCKQRRIKCDEQVPACGRCVSSGRLCDGYNTLRMAVGSSGTEGTVIRWAQQPSVHPGSSKCPLEQAAFTAFRERCLAHNGTMLQNAPLHSYFCQTAHSEPAVWHGIVALESLGYRRTEFAIQQYGKALAMLQRKITSEQRRSNVSVVLIACLIFKSFELLREGDDEARAHLHGALKLLAESRANPQEAPYGSTMIPTSVWESFERLDCANAVRTNKRSVLIQQAVDDFSAYSSTYSERFDGPSRTLVLALAATMELYDTVKTTGADVDFEVSQAKVNGALSRWASDMDAVEPQLVETVKQQRLRVSQMYYHVCKVLVSTMHLVGSDEIVSVYGNFTSDFVRCLALCTSFINTGALASTAYTQFSIHNGVILPLFLIAVKCRDSGVQKAALDLLQRCHHREGWWCGQQAAREAELAVRMEEEGFLLGRADGSASGIDVKGQLETTSWEPSGSTTSLFLPTELLRGQFALVPA